MRITKINENFKNLHENLEDPKTIKLRILKIMKILQIQMGIMDIIKS